MWFLVGKSRFLTAEAVWNDKGNGKRFGKGINVRGRKLTAES